MLQFHTLECLVYTGGQGKLTRCLYFLSSIAVLGGFVISGRYIEVLVATFGLVPMMSLIPTHMFRMEHMVYFAIVTKGVRVLLYTFYETWRIGSILYWFDLSVFLSTAIAVFIVVRTVPSFHS
jgi:hypothetical protein